MNRRRPLPPLAPASCFSMSATLTRLVSKTERSATSSPAATATPSPTRTADAFIVARSRNGTVGGAMATSRRIPHHARPIPTAAPSRASSRLSHTARQPSLNFPQPTAARTASSLPFTFARTSSRFDTFRQTSSMRNDRRSGNQQDDRAQVGRQILAERFGIEPELLLLERRHLLPERGREHIQGSLRLLQRDARLQPREEHHAPALVAFALREGGLGQGKPDVDIGLAQPGLCVARA